MPNIKQTDIHLTEWPSGPFPRGLTVSLTDRCNQESSNRPVPRRHKCLCSVAERLLLRVWDNDKPGAGKAAGENHPTVVDQVGDDCYRFVV